MDKGARNLEILKQPQYQPMSVEKQIAIIYLGTSNLLREVPVNKVKEFEEAYLDNLTRNHSELMSTFRNRKTKLSGDAKKTFQAVADELIKRYK